MKDLPGLSDQLNVNTTLDVIRIHKTETQFNRSFNLKQGIVNDHDDQMVSRELLDLNVSDICLKTLGHAPRMAYTQPYLHSQRWKKIHEIIVDVTFNYYKGNKMNITSRHFKFRCT